MKAGRYNLSGKIIVYHFNKQQNQHQKHDAADPLAAALDGKSGAQITAGYGEDGGGDRQSQHSFSLAQKYDHGAQIGGHVGNFGAAAGGQQIQSHDTGEAQDQKCSRAGTDQSIVAAYTEADGESGAAFHWLGKVFNFCLDAEISFQC